MSNYIKGASAILAFRSANSDALDRMAKKISRFSTNLLMGDPDAVPARVDRVGEHGLNIEYDLDTLRRHFQFHGASFQNSEERMQCYLRGLVREAREQYDLDCAYSDYPSLCLQTEGPE